MTKFIVVVFMMLQGNNMQFMGDKEVATLDECIELTAKINGDKTAKYNAACFIRMDGPKT